MVHQSTLPAYCAADRARTRPRDLVRPVAAAALGAGLTLCMRGYQFGQSNHTVYLVDALRRIDPRLLANDWWTTSTLQYHFGFTALTEWTIRLGVIEPVFLLGYLALVVLLHAAWLKLVRRLGGDEGTYLASVVLYYLLGGGLGLGVYVFMQDSAFLPSNIAAVAMLWGIYFWIARRPAWAGVCLGVAGMFHLNYALGGIALWVGLSAWEAIASQSHTPDSKLQTSSRSRRETRNERPPLLSSLISHLLSLISRCDLELRAWGFGLLILLGLSLFSIMPAVTTVMARSDGMPLEQFVDLYVRLRHPHHHDPSSWGWGLWLSFLLPLPLAIAAFRTVPRRAAVGQAARVFALFAIAIGIALPGAGVWFVSESLVQMSLYRFSIYLKLLSCIGAAYLILHYAAPAGQYGFPRAMYRPLLLAAAALPAAATGLLLWTQPPEVVERITPLLRVNIVPLLLFSLLAMAGLGAVSSGWRPVPAAGAGLLVLVLLPAWGWLGLRPAVPLEDAPQYLAICRWVSRNTPVDALLLVPPHEQAMRFHGQRAIVVNFKGVPQLSGELVEWRRRLGDVLEMEDFSAVPGPLPQALAAMREHYAARPTEHLLDVAEKYGADFIVTLRPLEAEHAHRLVHADESAGYFVYDLR